MFLSEGLSQNNYKFKILKALSQNAIYGMFEIFLRFFENTHNYTNHSFHNYLYKLTNSEKDNTYLSLL